MALIKETELENGVILAYHRIASLNKITNISNTIEVNSYINVKQRQKEKDYQILQLKNQTEELTEEEKELLEKGIDVMVIADFIQIPYNQEQTVEEAYEYLKTTNKYKDAKDS